jgi:hypothetical protein
MIGNIIIGIIMLIVVVAIISFIVKILVSVFIGFIVLAIIAVAGFWVYKKFAKKDNY